MALGIIEIFALIVVVVSAIKIIVLLVNPRIWYKSVVKKVYASPKLTTIIALILAVVVFYYLNQTGIDIIQIFAVMLFLMLLMAMSFAIYAKEVLKLADRMLRDHTLIKKAWLAILIWVILIVWVLYVLFA